MIAPDEASNQPISHFRLLFAMILIAASAGRMWFASTLAISGDEAYHWEWSRHLAASYYDHPGLTAWLIHASHWFLPDTSELMVRMPAILSLAGTAIVAYLFARAVALRSGDTLWTAERAGWFAGVLVIFVPILAVFGVYMSTDPPFIFAATLTWYLLFCAVETGRWSAWLGAGAALGLASTAKFLAFSIPPTALVILWAHRPYRRWLLRPQPWLALAVAVVVFSPVLVWNAANDWATFRFNFAARHADVVGWTWISPIEYLGGQCAALLPLVFFSAIAAATAAVRGWRRGDGPATVIAGGSLIPLGFFLAASVRRDIGLHWPAAFWVPLLVYVGVRWARVHHRRGRRYIAWALGTTVAFVVLGHFGLHSPPSWTDYDLEYPRGEGSIRLERANERFGWQDLGRHAGAERDEMLRARADGGVFLIGSSYGVAAGLSFYLPDQGTVHLWAPPRVHGENYRYWDHFGSLAGQDAIFVVKRDYQAAEFRPSLQRRFARVDETEEMKIVIDGRGVRSFFLIRCYDFDGEAPF